MSAFSYVYSRPSWGARHRAGFGDRSANYPLPECWTHHSVTVHLPENATVAQEKAQMRILEYIGQQRFGGGISYNFVIFPSGRVYMGTGASRIGAHTMNRNSVGLGVVFAGNYENHKPTKAAERAYAKLMQDFRSSGITRQARTNGGHRDAPGQSWNACPGNYLYNRLGAINSIAAGGNGKANTGGSGGSSKPSGGSSSGGGSSSSSSSGSSSGVRKNNSGTRLLTKGRVNIRSGPDSTGKGNIVGTVAKGHLLRRDKKRDTQHFYGVGRNWYVAKSVVDSVSAPASKSLIVGQWPGRRLPVNGQDTHELGQAWRELLARTGITLAGRTEMVQRHLASKGFNPGLIDGIQGPNTVRALQRYLNANGFNAGNVDGIRGANTIRGEKRFLNDQLKYVKSKWPQHVRNSKV